MKYKNEAPEPIKKIIKEVADYFHQDYIMVMSGRRYKDLVKVRNISMYFIKNEGHTLEYASSFFGLDYSTASVNLKKLEKEINKNRVLRNQFFELKDKVEDHSRDREDDEIDIEANDILSDVYGKIKKVTTETIEE